MAEALPAISLHQPWASFIAIGVKAFETRHWAPPARLIGQRIAIHAAKKRPDLDSELWASMHGIARLPLGAFVCTAILAGAYRCGPVGDHRILTVSASVPGSPPYGFGADEFGDYTPGRWAWRLDGIEPIDPVIPARGHQGWWRWERSDG